MDPEMFKLITKRMIAWPLIGMAIAGAGFLIVYGALSGQTELATMGAGALFTQLGTVTGFYFAKKTSEE